MKKLSALPSADPNARAFIRHFYANAVECEMDRQGRMTLPQELREYAGIDKELVTVGILDKLEVWGREVWDDEKEGPQQLAPADFARKMAEYGI